MPKPGEILKIGHWMYGGTIRCRIEIQFSNIRYGSGDHQDPDEWRKDKSGKWYVVSYSSPTDPSKCPPSWMYASGAPTLKEAIADAEATLRSCNIEWET
jgi:hypothetical protein